MNKTDVERFFGEVDRKLSVTIDVYLTGGTASWFMGGERPTMDIDFAVRARTSSWQHVQETLERTSRLLGIPVQFSEDISRWSMIDIPDYEKRAKRLKKIGKVTIFLLSPESWATGKIGRYYQSDVDDLVAVFKAQKTDAKKALRYWALALCKSPKSSDQFLFVKQVEDFLKNYGPRIWGKKFDAQWHISFFGKLIRTKP